MCFGDYQKLIDNGDRIGNLLEHLQHQNINFLVLGRGMSNLLEMLLPALFGEFFNSELAFLKMHGLN